MGHHLRTHARPQRKPVPASLSQTVPTGSPSQDLVRRGRLDRQEIDEKDRQELETTLRNAGNQNRQADTGTVHQQIGPQNKEGRLDRRIRSEDNRALLRARQEMVVDQQAPSRKTIE